MKGAAIAGFYGTPAIFGSGDLAFCKEAQELLPHVHTVEVKQGVDLDRGDSLSFEEYQNQGLGAVHIHPNRARALIREGAFAALKAFRENPGAFPPFRIDPPYTLEVWYRNTVDSPRYKTTQRHPSDIVGLYSAPAERSDY